MRAVIDTDTLPHEGIRPSGMRALPWLWLGALACFVLAGATGAWFRFAMLYDVSGGLALTGIRHAHSHLMYFGWATPALFTLIAWNVSRMSDRPLGKGVVKIIGATHLMALLAYPFFLFFGYRPVELGTVRVPLSVIAASLNMLVWYVFIAWYVRRTRSLERTQAVLLFDLSLGFLVLATLGAWGLALLQPFGIDDPVWTSSLTHLFLDLFSEGWFVLAVLGLVYAVRSAEARGGHWSLWLLAGGLPFTYAMGMPESLVSPAVQTLARAGTVAVALGLGVLTWPILRGLGRERSRLQQWLWGVPLGLLVLKLIAQFAVSTMPSLWWAELHGARILYLHVMLLGFVSLTLFAAARTRWGAYVAPGWSAFYGAVLVVLASLVLIAGILPADWSGPWAYSLVTWIAPLPALVVLGAVGRAASRLVVSAPSDSAE